MTSSPSNRTRISVATAFSLLTAGLVAGFGVASCGSDDGETATGGAGGMTGGAGGATGGAGGSATGGAGGSATGGAGGSATGGAGGSTGGAGGGTGGMGGATGGMGGSAMGGAAGGTGAPVSCMYAAKDNPNKAEVTWMTSDASADANLGRAMYSGETRSLVTYVANPALKLFIFNFQFPFVGLMPTPCTSFAFTIGGLDMPATGKSVMVPVPPIMNSVTLAESPECSPLISTWNAWYQAGPGMLTFTKVDGPNIEIDFSFPMGGKVSNKAMGSFTFKGHVKSPCYFVMP